MRPVALPSEILPVAGARQGDADAWETLFRRYQLPLYTYIHDLIRDPDAGFDLVQEVFIRAVRHLPGLREDARFGSWLFGIAHQQVIQFWRRRGRRPAADEPAPEAGEEPCPAPGPESELIRREDQACLLTAIDALPDSQRGVILLHYLEDFPLAEIAEITGVPLGTVKSRLHLARHALRAGLVEARPTSPAPMFPADPPPHPRSRPHETHP